MRCKSMEFVVLIFLTLTIFFPSIVADRNEDTEKAIEALAPSPMPTIILDNQGRKEREMLYKEEDELSEVAFSKYNRCFEGCKRTSLAAFWHDRDCIYKCDKELEEDRRKLAKEIAEKLKIIVKGERERYDIRIKEWILKRESEEQ